MFWVFSSAIRGINKHDLSVSGSLFLPLRKLFGFQLQQALLCPSLPSFPFLLFKSSNWYLPINPGLSIPTFLRAKEPSNPSYHRVVHLSWEFFGKSREVLSPRVRAPNEHDAVKATSKRYASFRFLLPSLPTSLSQVCIHLSTHSSSLSPLRSPFSYPPTWNFKSLIISGSSRLKDPQEAKLIGLTVLFSFTNL